VLKDCVIVVGFYFSLSNLMILQMKFAIVLAAVLGLAVAAPKAQRKSPP
jgi:hypothetical protein